MTSISPASSARSKLKVLQQQLAKTHLRTLFQKDPLRAKKWTYQLDRSLHVDFSKHLITEETLALLLTWAEERGLPAAIQAMFQGKIINPTENRPALHVALRIPQNSNFFLNGENIAPEILMERHRLLSFAEQVRQGTWLGYTGKKIQHVVNIGIGGSDLGPCAVVEALAFYQQSDLHIHFAPNVDGAQLAQLFKELNPETTLFIIVSKTFTTLETLLNAHTAKEWLVSQLGASNAIANHFVGVTTNSQAAQRFGIAATQVFPFWDWVGGRYSLWSSVGLVIAIAIGAQYFEELLTGAHAVDQHFQNTPLAQNLPVLMALLDIWYINFWGVQSHLVVPYAQALQRIPAHLQQLTMESNGKRVTQEGTTVEYSTSAVWWGEPGTNSQHAFFQWLHQGTAMIPTDFWLAAQSTAPWPEHQKQLIANCLAQSEALARGKTKEEALQELLAQGFSEEAANRLAPHREFPGNRPSSTFLVQRWDPATIGRMIALYEHQTYVEGVLWDINSFDQFGVELGKTLAQESSKLLDQMSEHKTIDLPAHWTNSTSHLLAQIQEMQ